jgi:insecticidal toxin
MCISKPGVLSVGGVKVTFTGRGRHDVTLQLTGRQTFKVNRGDARLDVLEQDAPAGEHEQSLLTHYQTLAREHRLVMPYTPVHHFPIPFEPEEQPRYTTAWYDAARDRFLYIRNEEVLAADEMLLAPWSTILRFSTRRTTTISGRSMPSAVYSNAATDCW